MRRSSQRLLHVLLHELLLRLRTLLVRVAVVLLLLLLLLLLLARRLLRVSVRALPPHRIARAAKGHWRGARVAARRRQAPGPPAWSSLRGF
jgi:hypothetical protein